VSAQVLGIIGVGMLLTGFGLNLVGWLSEKSPIYLLLNLVGALLAAVYAWSGGLIPFVVLELVWALVALWRLVQLSLKKT